MTMGRWRTVNAQIHMHLIPYMGNDQITRIPEEKWQRYTLWRKKEGGNLPPRKRKRAAVALQQKEEQEKPPERRPAKDGTIRQELMTGFAIMNFAVTRRYIREGQVPEVDLPSNKARREAFTRKEYNQLHTFARNKWIKKGKNQSRVWNRRSTYCFRHTYATFRLEEGVDVYFLAKQMGTSVKMIEEFYGHITPTKNAERILKGMEGWGPQPFLSVEKNGSVNAADAGKKASKRRAKK
jgi:integrase